jgi:ABC-type multidrug transport system fused ATPase/permease subunit
VIADGRIVESGTWEQLSLRSGSLFQRLWQLQGLEAAPA